jgi:septum formation protein
MKKLILASQSPRRKQLLTEAGFDFEVKVTDIAEDFPADMPAVEVPCYLAHKKAKAAWEMFATGDEVILASDSVVILDNIIYGKPQDYNEAVAILSALSARVHQVITGVCIMDKLKQEVFSSVANVYFKPLSRAEIDFYIEKYQPYDKAGAYAIQEWIGLCKIEKIEGTYSNIMGLPMEMVYEKLQLFMATTQ